MVITNRPRGFHRHNVLVMTGASETAATASGPVIGVVSHRAGTMRFDLKQHRRFHLWRATLGKADASYLRRARRGMGNHGLEGGIVHRCKSYRRVRGGER